MAETIKKSKIVSEEDDLEESLMQEFNLRLKTCMEPEETITSEEKIAEEFLYENVEIIKTNGKTAFNLIGETTKTSLDEFIQIEREHCETNGKKSDLLENDQNLGRENQAIYENLPPAQKNGTSIAEEAVVIKPPTDLKIPLTSLTDLSSSEDLELDEDGKCSARDRMLLSTDDASCLLFTQTVTSPMLTPSEENIDFLKGFQSQNTISDNTVSDSSPKSEDDLNNEEAIYENIPRIDLTEAEDDENQRKMMEETAREIEESARKEAEEVDRKELEEASKKVLKEVSQKKLKEVSQKKLEESSREILETFEKQEVEEEASPKDLEEGTKQLVENSSFKKVDDLPPISPQKEKQPLGNFQKHNEDFADSHQKVPRIINEIELEDNNIDEGIEIENNDESSALSKTGLFDNVVNSDQSIFDLETKEILSGGGGGKEAIFISNGDDFEETKVVLTASKVEDCGLIPSVQSLKSQYIKSANTENLKMSGKEKTDIAKLKSLDIMKQINKFEQNSDSSNNSSCNTSTETSESSYVETTTTIETKSSSAGTQEKSLKKKKSKKSRNHEKENISVQRDSAYTSCNSEENFYNVNVKSLCRSFGDLTKIEDDCKPAGKINTIINKSKSSFSKFDALQKKNVLHVRSSDSSKAQEKFNGNQTDVINCKSCGKVVFQMEQTKAEKCIWHKNCFRCTECNKQLTVDTYQSHEGTLYCKPHFKALFTPKAVEDNAPPSDKPDLGLEELQSLNVKERFQVFEHHQEEEIHERNNAAALNVKRSPSILSKLARFQAKGMDIGVTDDALNGLPIAEDSSDSNSDSDHGVDPNDEPADGEDAELVKARRAQREKPFHFVGMSDVKSKWEQQGDTARDERREERKQEIVSIRNRLFMGKQGKMKEMYQAAVAESEAGVQVAKRSASAVEVAADLAAVSAETAESAKSLKERFEKEVVVGGVGAGRELEEDMQVFESGISKQSRSIFLELDAHAAKAPPLSPLSPQKSSSNIAKAKEENAPTEVYRDPNVARAEEAIVEDSVVAKQTHTATKMLSKFRQMEENVSKDQVPLGPKPLKRFTPPPEPTRSGNTSSEEDGATDSGDDETGDEDEDDRNGAGEDRLDGDLIEAQKAARAKQLRAKFERWEANEIKREKDVGVVCLGEGEGEGEGEGQVESTKSLRARFESMKETSSETKSPRIKVHRFVDMTNSLEVCQDCKKRVYPLEKISVHGYIYHKRCFKCMECNAILRMDSYSYNQGLLYCTPHFKRLFISKGNYDTAFGLEQHKEKWNTTVA